jgi:hypothetical protein
MWHWDTCQSLSQWWGDSPGTTEIRLADRGRYDQSGITEGRSVELRIDRGPDAKRRRRRRLVRRTRQ